MKKVIFLVISIVLIFCATSVYALSPTGITPSGVITSELDNIGDRIIGAIHVIAGIVAVTVLIYMGIKIMMSAPSEKAAVKAMMIPYLVGAIIVFASTTLLRIIADVAGLI